METLITKNVLIDLSELIFPISLYMRSETDFNKLALHMYRWDDSRDY